MYCNTVIPLSFLLIIPCFLSPECLVCLSAFLSPLFCQSHFPQVSVLLSSPFCLLASASLSLCLSVRPSFLSPFPVCTCFFVCLYLFQHSPLSLLSVVDTWKRACLLCGLHQRWSQGTERVTSCLLSRSHNALSSDGEIYYSVRWRSYRRPCLATWRLAHNYTVIHSLQGTFVPCICSTKQA